MDHTKPAVRRDAEAKRARTAGGALPGLIVTLLIAAAATALAGRAPLLGAPVIAVVLGALLRQCMGMPAPFAQGVRVASKQVLQAAVVVLGAGLSLRQVWITGSSSLVVLVGTLLAGIPLMLYLGRLLRIDPVLTRLISVGTGICGASAIGAMAPILEADEATIAYAISTVFLFNITAVLAFPPLGHALGLSQHGFGLWAGTAVNDTSSVVAAGYTYGAAAGAYAVVVKLTRTVFILPISIIFTAIVARERRAAPMRTAPVRRVRLPAFIGLFLAACALNSLGLFGRLDPGTVRATGQFLIAVALAGIGLSADVQGMLRIGYRPLLLGFCGWTSLAVISLALQRVAGLT